jgi:hypothetical protein
MRCEDWLMALGEHNDFELRRSIRPYAGMIVIFSAISVIVLWPLNKMPSFGEAGSLLLTWLLFSIFLVLGRTYRILVCEECVVQRGWGIKSLSIPIEQIKRGVIAESGVQGELKKAAYWGGMGLSRIQPTTEYATHVKRYCCSIPPASGIF